MGKKSVNTNGNQTGKLGLQSVPVYIWFLLLVFVSGMILFFLFRLALLFINYDQIQDIPVKIVLYSVFNRGSLFDASVNSYILLIPFLLLSLANIIRINSVHIYKVSLIFIYVSYIVAVALLCVDIPYFAYFNSRLTGSILNWGDEFWLSVYARFSVPVYYPYVFIFILISFGFYYWVKFIAKRTVFNANGGSRSVYKNLIVFLAAGVLLFLGMRGDYKSRNMPLSIANTFFSDYSITNQLGLNPVYSFVNSWISKSNTILDLTDYIKITQNYLNIKSSYNSPIARDVTFSSAPDKHNVVLFIVESMSAYKFKRYGYKENIMPFMDSLAGVSVTFDNIYTSGVHTYDGIYSTLFSMPSGLDFKAMTYPLTAGQKHSGISNVLKTYEYTNAFFCTGNKNFDNMNGFLKNNEFDYIFSQDDYPPEYNFTEWGVPDHVMFDYSLGKFNEFSKSGSPFFAAFMTVSTHESIDIPDWIDFKPSAEDSYDKRFQYFDWSVSKFMKEAFKTDWFKNTIFVFIADHGQNFDQTYDMSLSYNHTPMIFYSPGIIKPQRFDKPGLQIDLFPTLMGFLKLPYVNNTLGVDLRKEGRKYAYFCTDNKVGCLNDEFFLVLRKDGPNSLYKYKNKNVENYYNDNLVLADDMKKYASAMILTSHWLGSHNLLPLPDLRINNQ